MGEFELLGQTPVFPENIRRIRNAALSAAIAASKNTAAKIPETIVQVSFREMHRRASLQKSTEHSCAEASQVALVQGPPSAGDLVGLNFLAPFSQLTRSF